MGSPPARTGLPLNDDLVDYILSLSTSLQDLISTVLTSKAFYNVYRLHPHSIIRSIACNIAGGAMPVALRCIRWTKKDGFKGGEDVERACLENNGLVTDKELKKLQRIAKAVDDLERDFSRRYGSLLCAAVIYLLILVFLLIL
jgi:hypothetical protein